MSDKPKTIIEYLDEVDYSNMGKNYVPSTFAVKFMRFIQLVNGEGGEENKSPIVHMHALDTIANKGSHVLNMCHRGFAKALALDTILYQEAGETTVSNCKVGDFIYGANGKLTEILAKSSIFRKPTYTITLADGRKLVVSEDHLNVVIHRTTKTFKPLGQKRTNKQGRRNLQRKIMTVPEMLGYSLTFKQSKRATPINPYGLEYAFRIPCNEAVKYPYLTLPSDPYILGLDMMATGRLPPLLITRGSVRQRIKFLFGVLSATSKVTASRYHVKVTTSSAEILELIVKMTRSLGFIAYPVTCCESFGAYLDFKNKAVGIVSIEKTPEIVSTQCIAVANGRKTFIAGDHIVTHNTTLFGEYMIPYLAVNGYLDGFGKVNYGIYVSDSIENGVKNMRKNLQYRWENSDFLREVLPVTKFTDVRWEFRNTNGGVVIFRGYGVMTGVRGNKELGQRPNFAILDDLMSDEDARSKTVRDSIKDTVYKAVTYALHSRKFKVVWSGTAFNANDPLYTAAESGAWDVNAYPVCDKFPCSEEEFAPAWGDRFDYNYVKEQYDFALSTGTISAFNQELMLRIMSDEERLIEKEDIQYYNSSLLLANRSAFNFYITTDWATSEEESADLSFTIVWAYNHAGDWFVVDAFMGKVLMNVNIDNLFRFASKYLPQEVGIEVSGQQQGFVAWIKEEMMNRNIYFNLAKTGNKEGIRPSTKTSKVVRFNTVVPLFKSGKIHLPEDRALELWYQEIVTELELATLKGFKSKHDDALDAIAMIPALNSWRPSEITPPVSSKKNRKDVGDYDPFIKEIDDLFTAEPTNRHALDSYTV